MALSRRRKYAIILSVLVVVLVVGGQLTGLITLPFTSYSGIDQSTHSFDYKGFTGGGMSLNRDPTTSPPGQLAPYYPYVASWDPAGMGETVNVVAGFKGEISECGYVLCGGIALKSISMYMYLQTNPSLLSGSKGDLGTLVQKWVTETPPAVGQSGHWYLGSSGAWTIQSPDGKTIIPDGSILTIQMWGDVLWEDCPIIGCYVHDQGTGLLAQQQVVILSGVGNVGFTNAHSNAGSQYGYYIVGETATFSWHTYYSSVTDDEGVVRGWYVKVVSQATGATVLGPVPITTTDGSMSYVVRASDYNPNSPNNELIVYLNNGVFDHAFNAISTVRPQDIAHMPTCTNPTISPQSPKQGDTVQLNFTCTPATNATIDQIKLVKVEWGWGSIENTLTLNPQPSNQYLFTFTATSSGYVTVAITAYTNGNVPSGTFDGTISIDHQPNNPCLGDAAFCSYTPPPPYVLPLWVWFVIAAIVLTVVAYFAGDFLDVLPIALSPKWIMYAIAGFLLLVAVLIFPM